MTSTNSIKSLCPPLKIYQKWFKKGGSWSTQLDPEKLAYILAQIYRPPLNPETPLTQAITRRYTIWNTIQSALQKNQKISMPSEEDSFFSIMKLKETWQVEINTSYSLLSFPFQETLSREEKNEAVISQCEERIVQGVEFLKDLTACDLRKKPTIEATYLVHKLLFFHAVLFKNDNPILWAQLYADWKELHQSALSPLDKIFPPPTLPQPMVKETAEKSSFLTFKEYLIKETILSIETHYEIKCPQTLRSFFENTFKDERSRLDVIYFVQFPEELKKLSLPLKRGSDKFLRLFQIMNRFMGIFTINEEERCYLLELIFWSDPDLGFPYLPENLQINRPFSSILQVIQKLAPKVLSVQKQLRPQEWGYNSSTCEIPQAYENLFYLIEPMIEELTITEEMLVACPQMTVTEMLYLLSDKKRLQKLMNTENDPGIDSLILSEPQKRILNALLSEEIFCAHLQTLKPILETVNLDMELVFHLILNPLPAAVVHDLHNRLKEIQNQGFHYVVQNDSIRKYYDYLNKHCGNAESFHFWMKLALSLRS